MHATRTRADQRPHPEPARASLSARPTPKPAHHLSKAGAASKKYVYLPSAISTPSSADETNEANELGALPPRAGPPPARTAHSRKLTSRGAPERARWDCRQVFIGSTLLLWFGARASARPPSLDLLVGPTTTCVLPLAGTNRSRAERNDSRLLEGGGSPVL